MVELKDGVYYKPFTTLEGIAEKHSGQEPFNVGNKLLNKITSS